MVKSPNGAPHIPSSARPSTTSVIYSIATTSHTAKLVSLINAAFASDTTDQAWLSTARVDIAHPSFIEPMLAAPDTRFLIATADPAASSSSGSAVRDGILGCCFVRHDPGTSAPTKAADDDQGPPASDPATTAWLGFLCVDPTLHGTGLGRGMLRYAESYIRREWPHVKQLELNVVSSRKELQEWYERYGFVKTGRVTAFPYGPKEEQLEGRVLRAGLAMWDFRKDLV